MNPAVWDDDDEPADPRCDGPAVDLDLPDLMYDPTGENRYLDWVLGRGE